MRVDLEDVPRVDLGREFYNTVHDKRGRFGVKTGGALKSELGQSPASISDYEKDALVDYQDAAYYSINKGLYESKGKKPSPAAVTLDRAFNNLAPLKSEGQVYRSVDLTHRHPDIEVKPGTVLNEYGFSSASFSRALASKWGGPDADLMVIKLPKGSKAMDVNAVLGRRSRSGSEREALLPRSTSLFVTSVKARHTRPWTDGFGNHHESGEGKIIEATVVRQVSYT